MLIINSKASDKQNYKDLMGTGRLVLAPLPAGTSFRIRFLSTSKCGTTMGYTNPRCSRFVSMQLHSISLFFFCRATCEAFAR